MICMLIFANYTAHAVGIDLTSSAAWKGYMNVFENNNWAPGTWLFGSDWGKADLASSWAGNTVSLTPNTNGYADNVNGAVGDVAYWTNSQDGGTTPGLDGNKFMEATLLREADGENGESWLGQTLKFSGTITNFDLDGRYDLTAFVKYLDVDNGYAVGGIDSHSITATGDYALSLDIPTGNFVAQIGFTMKGLNANPATDWGSADISSLDAEVIPEPSTYALLAGFAAFLFVAIRRRK